MANSADLYNGKQLYIAHLAARLEAMERSNARLNAFSYRLWSRRLREAMAGCPEPLLANGLAVSHPSVCLPLEQPPRARNALASATRRARTTAGTKRMADR